MTNEIPEWSKLEWVSRQLKMNDILDLNKKSSRVRLHGKNLRTVVITRQRGDSVVIPFQSSGGIIDH